MIQRQWNGRSCCVYSVQQGTVIMILKIKTFYCSKIESIHAELREYFEERVNALKECRPSFMKDVWSNLTESLMMSFVWSLPNALKRESSQSALKNDKNFINFGTQKSENFPDE
uniref:Uncharacterized protein n=1 Tax=Romanomermis culicivorax TaxID=13658 RepID=A0A915IK90_ROMCU